MDSLFSINTGQRERQTAYNNHRVGAPFQQLGHISAGRVVHCTVLVGYTSALDIPLSSGGPSPKALTLCGGVRLIAWRLRRPFLKGMPTEPGLFIGLPDASGLRPCIWNHLKNGFVPHTYARWGVCQIPVHRSAWHNHVRYHLRNGRIVTAALDSQLSTN